MTDSHSSIINQLRQVLERECRVQSAYVKALSDETKAMTPFNTDRVESLNLERSELCEEMLQLQERRKELVAALGGNAEMKLGEAIDKFCSPRDKQALFPLMRRLKELVHQSRRDTQEFGSVTSFSLGLVNSLISLVTSSKNGVARSYSGRGILRESYHPSGSRLSSVLKEA